jgi:hypothetical protein
MIRKNIQAAFIHKNKIIIIKNFLILNIIMKEIMNFALKEVNLLWQINHVNIFKINIIFSTF